MSSANLPSSTAKPGRAPHLGAHPPVDLAHLSRYTFGDHGLEKEVLSLFLAQIPETMASLSTASTERDWMMAAHALKGSSRAVGAWRLGDLAEQAERHHLLTVCEARSALFANLQEATAAAQAFIHSVYGAP